MWEKETGGRMKYLRTEGILPRVLDRDLPEELQYIKEWDIYEAYKCDNCGYVHEEEPSDEKCTWCNDFTTFSKVEVLEDLEEIDEV